MWTYDALVESHLSHSSKQNDVYKIGKFQLSKNKNENRDFYALLFQNIIFSLSILL